jgi:hypothetical protein
MNYMKVIQILMNFIIIFIVYFFLKTFCSNQINSNRRNHCNYFIIPNCIYQFYSLIIINVHFYYMNINMIQIQNLFIMINYYYLNFFNFLMI